MGTACLLARRGSVSKGIRDCDAVPAVGSVAL